MEKKRKVTPQNKPRKHDCKKKKKIQLKYLTIVPDVDELYLVMDKWQVNDNGKRPAASYTSSYTSLVFSE